MTNATVKDDARRLVERLPEDATWEDLQYQINFRQAVKAGLKDSREWRTIPLAEVRRRDDPSATDELRPEYDPSILKGGVRGKYLGRDRAGTNLALLAPEVRAAFPTDEAVNQALRSLISDRQPI